MTVILYRAGIVLSTGIISAMILGLLNPPPHEMRGRFGPMLLALYVSVGLSVFFIHLYIGRFHKALELMYVLAVLALIVLYKSGGGDVLAGLSRPFGPLLLLPLSACLGFVTAKEAFCFGLNEGYVLAVLMPFSLILMSAGRMTAKWAAYVLAPVALLLILFTLRKVFQPVHYDVGDKSAYR